LEAAGKPTFLITTNEFSGLAREAARSQGLPATRIVVVDHPIGGIDNDALRRRGETATDRMLSLLTKR
jgi:hypothetical protein